MNTKNETTKPPVINLRVSKEEKELITKYANDCNMNTSEYLRQSALKSTIQANPNSQELAKTLIRINIILDSIHEDNKERIHGNNTTSQLIKEVHQIWQYLTM